MIFSDLPSPADGSNEASAANPTFYPQIGFDVRFGPKATEMLRCREVTRSAKLGHTRFL
jgi:hypothetical protein